MDKVKARINFLFPENTEQIESIFDFEKLNFLLQFLEQEHSKNFFSKNDSKNILDRHIIEPLYHIYLLERYFNFKENTTICDCGTGMGIPGILFFCLKKKIEITLLDSQKKKLSILQKEIEKKYPLSEICFVYKRAEELKKTFDFVISRAFIPYPFCVEVVTNLLNKGSYYIPFLGKLVEVETFFLNKNGFQVKEKISIKDLNFLGQRHIIILEKTHKPKNGHPRSWKIINKEIKIYNEKNNIN